MRDGIVDFRFLRLTVWQDAVKLAHELLDVAVALRAEHDYSLADQLARAAISISNNIAEGSGSFSRTEFAYFLNVARRSTFENANMVVLLEMKGRLSAEDTQQFLMRLYRLSRQITALRKSVRASESDQSKRAPQSPSGDQSPRNLEPGAQPYANEA